MSSAIASTMAAADTALSRVESAHKDVAALLARIARQQQRIIELETEVSLVEEDRDTALELLLWPFLVKHETTEEFLDYLGEHGLNPRQPEHAESIAAFLESRAEFISAVTALMESSDCHCTERDAYSCALYIDERERRTEYDGGEKW